MKVATLCDSISWCSPSHPQKHKNHRLSHPLAIQNTYHSKVEIESPSKKDPNSQLSQLFASVNWWTAQTNRNIAPREAHGSHVPGRRAKVTTANIAPSPRGNFETHLDPHLVAL